MLAGEHWVENLFGPVAKFSDISVIFFPSELCAREDAGDDVPQFSGGAEPGL